MRSIVSILLALICLPVLTAGASAGLQYSMAIQQISVDGKRRLLSVHGSPQVFELSPDHTQFAYVSDEYDGTRSSELRVADIRGSGERSLVRAPSSIWDVAWAPNGRTLALSVSPSGPGARGVWLVEAEGTGLRRVADYGSGLAWSPDSQQLAMSRRIDNRPPDLISVLSVETGVTHDIAPGTDPQWSPDGKSLLYHYSVPSGLIQIRVISADGGQPLTVANGWRSAWSPDGKRVAFHSSAGKVPTALWIVSSRGGRPRLLVKWSSLSAWAPNGRSLAFVNMRFAFLCGPRFKSTLGLVRLSNGKTRRLLVTRRALSPLAWSRDSRTLLFTTLLCPGY